jgi:hypothetical protein
MILSFALGTILFASTAFAEVNSKSGYVQLKDALKYTAESCSSKLASYTVDMSVIMKDNGNIISSENDLIKYDITKSAEENTSMRINGSKAQVENYYYSDKDGSISFNSEQGVYYVNKLENQGKGANFTNPFKEKGAGDVEKIADALVGDLKDSVVVTENTDGTKQLSGTLSEAQIPAIANAVVSYQLKSAVRSTYNNSNKVEADATTMPKITDDVYVKEIKGNMTLGKDGLIQSAMGTGSLSGKDEQAKEHNLTFELLVKITNVNKTIVNKPDLSGKKVETSVQKDYSKISKPQMYLGTYKNDIVIEKDDKFQKIGERIVDITSLDVTNVSGRYHEEYIKGYEDYSKNAKDFKFATKFQEQLNANFNSTDTLGNNVNGNLWINVNDAEIGFGITEEGNQNTLNNGQYNRVFN